MSKRNSIVKAALERTADKVFGSNTSEVPAVEEVDTRSKFETRQALAYVINDYASQDTGIIGSWYASFLLPKPEGWEYHGPYAVMSPREGKLVQLSGFLQDDFLKGLTYSMFKVATEHGWDSLPVPDSCPVLNRGEYRIYSWWVSVDVPTQA